MYTYLYKNVEHFISFNVPPKKGVIFRHDGGDIYLVVIDIDKKDKLIYVEDFNPNR